VYREFVDILKSMGLYDESLHNKTEHTISLWGNYVEFFSLSDSQKVRGAKRNILFILLLSGFFLQLYAQAPRPKSKYIEWTNVSFGYEAPVYRDYPRVPVVNISHSIGLIHFFRAGFTCSGIQFYPEGYTINSLSMTYGRRFVTKYFLGAAFAGTSYNWFQLQHPNVPNLVSDWSRFRAPGLVLNLEMNFRPPRGKELGFGFEAYCNLNRVVNSYGIRFNLCLSDGR